MYNYDEKAHEKAADAAIEILKQGQQLRLVNINTRCTEPVIETLQPLLPLKWDYLADITIGLGSGFSNMGEVCGALVGAIICIGVDLAGRYRDTGVLRLLNIKFTQKIMHDFSKEFGAVRCKELLGGWDISGILTPGDETFAAYLKAKKEGKIEPCDRLIRWAIMYPLPSEQEELHPPL